MTARCRVVKVGGSLFDLSDLSDRLLRLFATPSATTTIFLAGGGPLAAAVRQWDRRFALESDVTHWMCIDLLDVTATLLHHLLPQSQLVVGWDELRAASEAEGGLVVFSPGSFLRHHEQHFAGPTLQPGWQVTSDSIAARVAGCLKASELVLLKSCDLPPGTDRKAAAAAGLIDAAFPQTARNLLVHWVNLRAADPRGGKETLLV